MAAKSQTVWAVDVGNCSLKALRLAAAGDHVEVVGFDNIEHAKILSGTDVTAQQREELIANSLHEFASRNNVSKEEVVISVPAQSSFARFTKLPPVEAKRIPEVVRFEAVQQIPFDINEVEWDWQLMEKPDSREVEVGIFAIKNEIVNALLQPFTRESTKVTCVQMAPIALYNYAQYDRKDLSESDKKGVVILDMGAENTDLVVCTCTSVWQRCIPLGGNAFTRAVAEAFKLDFEKAEKLKRTAPMSKYARQILQAMKPVFTDLGAEIQRSLGFYTGSKREVKLTKVIVFGGGMKLQGMGKFLQQMLQLPVLKPDSFDRLTISSGVPAAKFHENVADFGVVYGLALQGLGLAKIESNLLPRRIARAMMWARKAKYLTAAACLLLVVCLLAFVRANYDKGKYAAQQTVRDNINRVLRTADDADRQLKEVQALDPKYEAEITRQLKLFEYRQVVPQLYETIMSCLPNARNTPGQAKVYEDFASNKIVALKEIPRSERKQLFVTKFLMDYSDDVAAASLEQTGRGLQRTTTTRRFSEAVPGAGGGTWMPGMPGIPGMPGMPGMPEMGRGGVEPVRRRTTTTRDTGLAETKEEVMPGFVVIMEGYSPFKKIADLLDPVGVKNDQARWGLVTRLMNLDKLFKDTPFELYKKTEIQHFTLETGEVKVGSQEMPEGMGVLGVRTFDLSKKAEADDSWKLGRQSAIMRDTSESDKVLVDPMTREIISTIVERDEYGKEKLDAFSNPVRQVNDYWFRIRAKLVWKGAPAATGGEETKGGNVGEQVIQ